MSYTSNDKCKFGVNFVKSTPDLSARLTVGRGALLLVEDDVREPDALGGHPDGPDAPVLLWVPAQLVVGPLLGRDTAPRQTVVGNTYRTGIYV